MEDEDSTRTHTPRSQFSEPDRIESRMIFRKAVPSSLRLPDLIERLAQESEVLVWDDSNRWYKVIDSQGFQEKFNALRCTRAKRNEDAANRPFARMHIHFVLVRGERWAGNGSAFRPKTEMLEPIHTPKTETQLETTQDASVLNESSLPLSKGIGCTRGQEPEGPQPHPQDNKRPRLALANGQDGWSNERSFVDDDSDEVFDTICRQVDVVHTAVHEDAA